MRASWPDGRTAVVLSAHTADLVRTDASAILSYLDRASDVDGPDLDSVAAHLVRTRRIRRHRTVIRAADRDELTIALRAVAAGDEHPLVTDSSAGAGRLAFVFPGQGTQWPGMGAEPYRELPAYRHAADTCAAAFVVIGKPSPLNYLITAAAQPFSEIEIEGAQFIHAVALAHVWQACGIAPDLTVGHSLGEVAGAYIAGSITLDDAVRVIAARAGVVDLLPGRYAVAALGIGADDARELIAGLDGWLELSVVNSSTSVAVSGDRDAVLSAVAAVAAGGRFAREITVGFPVHTSILEPLRDGLRAELPDTEFDETAVQFVGAATGGVVAPGTRFVDYWYGNLRDMVRFDRAIATAVRLGARSFVELSAHPALASAVTDVFGQETAEEPALLVGSGRRDQPLVEQLSANIAFAAAADPGFDWRAGADLYRPFLPAFPNAPMHNVHLWAKPEPLPALPGLNISVEQWQPMPLPVRTVPAPRVAVVPAGPLAESLTRHLGADLITPADAELLVVVAPAIDASDVPAAAGAVAAMVGDGLLNYPTMIGPHCRTVCLVTVGAEQVHPGQPVVSPGHAALAAMHRSIGFEHPDCSFVHLDLAVTDPPHLDTVVATLLAEPGSGALRDGIFWRRDLREAVGVPWALDGGALDEVVITGGAGMIGWEFTRHLAERGAHRIVLLSRRGVDPSALADVTTRYGTVVDAPRCDITDPDAMADVAARHGSGGASLLIHAAGTATLATVGELTAAACADTFAAKLTGLAHLTEHWPQRPDARILLCSSVSGVWGGLGHGAYSAANRMLDVMADHLRAAGRQCSSVRWGLWQGAGIVDATETAVIERSGLRPMSPELAVEAGLCGYAGDPLVFAADEQRLRIFLDAQCPTPPPAPADPRPGPAASTADAVRAELTSVLSLTGPATVDLDTELFDLGLDSLLAIDLRKRLMRSTGRTIALARLLGGITGTELVNALEAKEVLASDRSI
ncbi:mycobactin polyketide synthase MbtD [soil metagenome]